MGHDLNRRQWGIFETVALIWIPAAMIAGVVVAVALDGALPIFTLIWLIGPLIVLLRTRDAARLGLRAVPWSELLQATALNLLLLWGLMAIFEPWTGIYRRLVREAVASSSPDTTFAWLTRFDGPGAWLGMVLYSGAVTLFAEELFFRGWLLQLLDRRMATWIAVALQAALFSVPQGLAALLFPPGEAVLWIIIYSWLGIGVIGGWFAARTQSIWPSLITATLTNLVLTTWTFI